MLGRHDQTSMINTNNHDCFTAYLVFPFILFIFLIWKGYALEQAY